MRRRNDARKRIIVYIGFFLSADENSVYSFLRVDIDSVKG